MTIRAYQIWGLACRARTDLAQSTWPPSLLKFVADWTGAGGNVAMSQVGTPLKRLTDDVNALVVDFPAQEAFRQSSWNSWPATPRCLIILFHRHVTPVRPDDPDDYDPDDDFDPYIECQTGYVVPGAKGQPDYLDSYLSLYDPRPENGYDWPELKAIRDWVTENWPKIMEYWGLPIPSSTGSAEAGSTSPEVGAPAQFIHDEGPEPDLGFEDILADDSPLLVIGRASNAQAPRGVSYNPPLQQIPATPRENYWSTVTGEQFLANPEALARLRRLIRGE